MLRPGTALAIDRRTNEVYPSIFHEAPYRSDWAFKTPTGLYVMPQLTGSGWKALVLPISEEAKNARVDLVKNSMTVKNRYPFSFDVKITTAEGQSRVYTLRPSDRVSRKGLEENRTCCLSGGYESSIYIGLFGLPNAGKSCFAYACRTRTNLSRLERLIGAQIDTKVNAELHEKFPSSPLSTYDGTPLSISLGRKKLDVCLVDMAGELFSRMESNHLLSLGSGDDTDTFTAGEREIMDQIARNSRLFDACLLLQKGRTILTDEMVRFRTNYLLETLSPTMLSAVVLTEGRVLQQGLLEREAKSDRVDLDALLLSNSPLFLPVTSKSELERHVALAHSVYQDVVGKTNHAVFLIDSLREEGEEQCYAEALNVELPLAWILSRLTSSIRIR